MLEAMRRAILPGKDCRRVSRACRAGCGNFSRTSCTRTAARRASSADGQRIGAGVPVVVHTIHGLAFTASTVAIRATVPIGKPEKCDRADYRTHIVCVADAMRDQSLAGGVGRPEQYVDGL